MSDDDKTASHYGEREEPADRSLANEYVERYLERHGIDAQADKIKYVGQTVFGEKAGADAGGAGKRPGGYHQARRRLIGETTWQLDELRDLAASFGERLGDLFDEVATAVSTTSAVLYIGTERVECEVQLGSQASSNRNAPLVARKIAGEVVIMPGPKAYMQESFEVRSLTVPSEFLQRPPYRIAVLDDDEGVAVGVAKYATASGFEATAFFNLKDLAGAIAVRPFDGYVIDWHLKGGTSRDLISDIRATDPTCPIAVLTGEVVKGNLGASELESLASRYSLMTYDKPTRTENLTSGLKASFSQRRRAGV